MSFYIRLRTRDQKPRFTGSVRTSPCQRGSICSTCPACFISDLDRMGHQFAPSYGSSVSSRKIEFLRHSIEKKKKNHLVPEPMKSSIRIILFATSLNCERISRTLRTHLTRGTALEYATSISDRNKLIATLPSRKPKR